MNTCAELEEYVADYLEGSLPAPRHRATQVHLDDCATCREFVAAYRRTVGVAKKVLEDKSAAAEAPERLVESLVQAILVSLAR
jgi:anti-sigma factor RsiW